MQTYTIYAVMDGELYTVANAVLDEELEGELQHLTRKHEFKNVTCFYIQEEYNDTHTDLYR